MKARIKNKICKAVCTSNSKGYVFSLLKKRYITSKFIYETKKRIYTTLYIPEQECWYRLTKSIDNDLPDIVYIPVYKPNTAEKAICAFKALVENKPQAEKLQPVCDFICRGICNMESKEVSVDSDMEDNLLNITVLLEGGKLLSVSKRLGDLDNPEAAVNIFTGRSLESSLIIDINQLDSYVRDLIQK